MNTDNDCMRCGRCCSDVGRTFWKGGLLEPQIWDDLPQIKARANNGDHEDEDKPCEMLILRDGQHLCRLHADYGYKYKPKMCRDYPSDGELCRAEQVFLDAGWNERS